MSVSHSMMHTISTLLSASPPSGSGLMDGERMDGLTDKWRN